MQSNRELAEEAAESNLFEENEQYLTEQINNNGK